MRPTNRTNARRKTRGSARTSSRTLARTFTVLAFGLVMAMAFAQNVLA
jgi:hypothetical protein